MARTYCDKCGYSVPAPISTHVCDPELIKQKESKDIKKIAYCEYCRRHVTFIHDHKCPNQKDFTSMKDYYEVTEKYKSQTLYAFWDYDLCPYVLGGKITEFKENGRVRAKGYDGMSFKPIAILPGKAGADALNKLNELRTEYNNAERYLKQKYKRMVRIGILGLEEK